MATMDFALARFSHQVWKIRLKSFVDGHEEMDQSEAVSHKECDLGKWLYSTGLEQFGDMAEMSQLEQTHASLHKTVSHIIRLKNSGFGPDGAGPSGIDQNRPPVR